MPCASLRHLPNGVSFEPVIDGKAKSARAELFLSYINVQRAIRDERWKMIRYPAMGTLQIFDLKNDPQETKNLVDEEALVPHMVALPVRTLQFGPDSRRLLVSDDQNLILYELGFGRPVRFVREFVEGATFSPDGGMLALAGWFGIRLVHPDRLDPLGQLELNDCGPESFHANGAGLISYGRFIGPWHWPIRKEAGRITVGPPNPIIPMPANTRTGRRGSPTDSEADHAPRNDRAAW